MELCRFEAITAKKDGTRGMNWVFTIDPFSCEGCGVCARFCPAGAIWMKKNLKQGQWLRSSTRFGPLIHAKLGIAQENSGKLVNLVRAQARKTAQEEGCNLILVDGPPGIGCPVIASITGSDLVIVVVEPSKSAFHDLTRVVDLTRHFGIETMIVVNKWDLNPEITSELESFARKRNLKVVGKVPYDKTITEAQIKRKAITEYQNNGITGEISRIWEEISRQLNQPPTRIPQNLKL
jgi:MinD superfamily P-loop ATPase